MFIIEQILRSIAGRLYLFFRYGNKSKEIADRDFMGDYSIAGGKVILQMATITILALAAGLLIAALVYGIKHLCGIKQFALPLPPAA